MTDLEKESTDEQIIRWVKLAQGGDTHAFEQLFHQTQGLARKIAFSILGPNSVEDALQESYLLVYRKLPQLREPAAFIGWLSRLVLHTSYRTAKRCKPSLELPQDAVDKSNPTEQLLESLSLRQALHRLPQRDRDVLILRELLSLSYDEVAFALKLPVGTVRSRLHAARKKLAKSLKL